MGIMRLLSTCHAAKKLTGCSAACCRVPAYFAAWRAASRPAVRVAAPTCRGLSARVAAVAPFAARASAGTTAPGCRMPSGAGFRVLSALVYEYPLDRIIAGAKFRQRLDFAAALGGLLGDCTVRTGGHVAGRISGCHRAGAAASTPAGGARFQPGRRNRRRRSHSALVAAAYRCLYPGSAHDRTDVADRTCPASQSRRCVCCRARELAGLRVAIVDDVLTTGSTARAVAAAVHGGRCPRVRRSGPWPGLTDVRRRR